MNEVIKPIEIISQLTLFNPKASVLEATNDVEAISTWLREYRDSKNTFIAYQQCVERFYIWLTQRNKKLTDLSREDVQDYQDFLKDPAPAEFWCGPRASKVKKNGEPNPEWRPFVKGLSIVSVNYQLNILKNLYNYLIQAGYLPRNPFALVKLKKREKAPVLDRVLEKRVIGYVMEYLVQLPETEYHLEFEKQQAIWLMTLFFLTGMRISEVAKSRMDHFIHRRNKWWLRVVGKGDKYAEIVATHELIEALVRYRVFLHRPTDYPVFDEDFPTVCGFRGSELKGLSANMIHRIIKKIFAGAAEYTRNIDNAASYILSRASAHWLRHASATAQLDAGIALESVKDNLRHESVETTMRYVHKNKDDRHDETTNKFGSVAKLYISP